MFGEEGVEVDDVEGGGGSADEGFVELVKIELNHPPILCVAVVVEEGEFGEVAEDEEKKGLVVGLVESRVSSS